MINTSTTPVTADLTDLANASVRELLAMLTHTEDRLRTTPFLVPDGDAMVVNPEVAPLLSRQRSVVAQLRVRRDTWRGAPGGPTRQGGRTRSGGGSTSASWPRPPWS
ncbi:hypothetical protein SAMN05216199_2034 [Pedococcus cremeus]|uniref:Uncharacterized protein n=1 Tax=Pedococcus cremeus TaxID=587636 RepID=A0A1H9UPB5_9MICO|nr:hypothetical protein [Pedococcus cremeus]SES11189.1 hypothetical protein SAMN05216199_2034 [Pedococcus cremeus]